MSIVYPNGMGASLGDALGLAEPLLTSASVIYVHHSGTSSNGTPERPYATLLEAMAVVNGGSGDQIVALMDGHAETIASASPVTVSVPGVTIAGLGASSGLPTVALTFNIPSADPFVVAANDFELRNVKLLPGTGFANNRLYATGVSRIAMRGCYVECGTDQAATVKFSDCLGVTLESCTFVSVATSLPTSSMVHGLELSGASGIGYYLNSCVFDGGAYGFYNGIAAVIGTAEANTEALRILNLSLLRGADLQLNDMFGWVNPAVSTGSAKVTW